METELNAKAVLDVSNQMDKEWDYYTWDVVIPPNEIKNINSVIEKNYCMDQVENGAPSWKNLSSVKLVEYGYILPLIGNFINEAHRIGTTGFGYNIFPIYNSTFLNHSIYDSKDKADYDWHRDASESPKIDCKLTLLINLSDEPYEGGQFQVHVENEPCTIDSYNKPGSAIIFKSHIIYLLICISTHVIVILFFELMLSFL